MTTPPLTEERLAEIEARAKEAGPAFAAMAREDVLALAAEVRRLTAEIARIEQERKDEREDAAEQIAGEDW